MIRSRPFASLALTTVLLAACGDSGSSGGGQDAGPGGGAAAGAGGAAGSGGTGGGVGGGGGGVAGTSAGSGGTGGSAGAATGGGAGGAATAGSGGAATAGRGGAAGGAAGAGGRGGSAGTTGVGSWQLLAPMPGGARQEHGVAAAGGIVYVIGNFGTAAAARRLEAFDPATGIWSTRAMLPFAADHPNVAAAANGRIYVLGATGTTSSAEYDPAMDMWTMKRPIPTQRAAAATASIGNKIYVAGGSMGNNGASAGPTVRDFAAYDVTTDMWELLEQIPAPERNHGPGAAVGGIFYILGGRTAGPTDNLQSRVDAFDPGTGQWTARAPMPRARGGCSAAVLGGSIIVVGGEGNPTSVNPNRVFPETDIYDPVANSWRTLAPMRTPRHGMGAAVVGNTLYVPGGATAQGGGTAVAILESFTL